MYMRIYSCMVMYGDVWWGLFNIDHLLSLDCLLNGQFPFLYYDLLKYQNLHAIEYIMYMYVQNMKT